MQVYFLEAGQRLTKHYTQVGSTIEFESYPHVADFKSHEHTINSIEEFHEAFLLHAAKGHCLLKGQLTKPLHFESRAGSTDPNTPTEFLVLDIDGLPDHTPEQVLGCLGLPNTDYMLQYSASQGVTPKKGLSCHIFMLLDRPMLPSMLKQWLIQKNLECFERYTTLTASGVALHYPIDVTACQNDKLIYIAPPICKPPALDTLSVPRIWLHVA